MLKLVLALPADHRGRGSWGDEPDVGGGEGERAAVTVAAGRDPIPRCSTVLVTAAQPVYIAAACCYPHAAVSKTQTTPLPATPRRHRSRLRPLLPSHCTPQCIGTRCHSESHSSSGPPGPAARSQPAIPNGLAAGGAEITARCALCMTCGRGY